MRNRIYIFSIILALFACKPKAEKQVSNETEQSAMDIQTIKKIDVHSHFQYDREYLPAFMKKWNMQGVLVDVYTPDSAGVFGNWPQYLALAKKHPDLFYLCAAFSGDGIDTPDFTKKTIERLAKEISEGARMVKVWKNFGMVSKDAKGKYIQIDDPRLQPIWDFLKEKQIPVMAHIGEPEQAWRPLDPDSPHYGYYKEHPQYHAYNFPEIPSYETIIAARDHWIQNNPDLKILCAHLGSMSHNVEMVAERLDKYPNMYVETAARFGDLARQDNKKVASFFRKYQDRIMFGTDYGNDVPQETLTNVQLSDELMDLDKSYDVLWKYLSGKDTVELSGHRTGALGLEKPVLEKVYHQNITDFLKLNN